MDTAEEQEETELTERQIKYRSIRITHYVYIEL